MRASSIFFFIAIYRLLTISITAPLNYDDAERIHHRRRKKKPCRRGTNGKTFFDLSISYINIDHNYNINCGGPYLDGGLSIANKPSHHQENIQFGSHNYGTHEYAVNEENEQNIEQTKVGGNLFNFDLLDWLLGIKKPSLNFYDKPVQEFNYDQVTAADPYLKPDHSITAYNPIFGNYVQDVRNFSFVKLLKPLYDFIF